MHFLTLSTIVTLCFSAVSVQADPYAISSTSMLWDLGEVSVAGTKDAPTTIGTDCNGVPDGDYACGNNGSVGTTLYQCTGGQMKLKEQCYWARSTGGQCTKNSRTGGKKAYYPFVNGKKGVCVGAKFN